MAFVPSELNISIILHERIFVQSERTAGATTTTENKSSFPFKLLKNITDGFSDDRLLGEGAFGTVYKVRTYLNSYATEISVLLIQKFTILLKRNVK